MANSKTKWRRVRVKAKPRGRPGDAAHMAMMREHLAAKRKRNAKVGRTLRAARHRRQLRVAFAVAGRNVPASWLATNAERLPVAEVPALVQRWCAAEREAAEARQAEQRQNAEAHRRANPTCQCDPCKTYRLAAL